MANVLSIAMLNRVTTSLAKSGMKYNEAMQTHMVNIIEFANNPVHNPKNAEGRPTGQLSPALILLQSITRKSDRALIKNWFVKHGLMQFREATPASGKKPAKAESVSRPSKYNLATYNVKEAEADLWYADKATGKKSTIRTTKFDLVARITSLMEAVDDIIISGVKIDGDNIDDTVVAELRELFAKINPTAAAEENAKLNATIIGADKVDEKRKAVSKKKAA